MNIFQQPYPTNHTPARALRYTLYAALCVFGVLYLFRPFGFHTLSQIRQAQFAACFAATTFLIASFNALFWPRILPTLFSENKWTVARELANMTGQVLTVAGGNLLTTHWLSNTPLSTPNARTLLWQTIIVAAIPIGFITLLKQQLLLKKYSREATLLDQQLKNTANHETTHTPASTIHTTTLLTTPPPISILPFNGPSPDPEPIATPIPPATTANFITFTSDNGHEQSILPPSDIRYIEAADNYIRITYLLNGHPTVQILRTTLKRTEATLAPWPVFFRCHRTYIVNLQSVVHVSGNAQGYKLQLNQVPDTIPVSRHLNFAFNKQLQTIHHPLTYPQ